MAKFGTGELYATDLLYGIDPQYLLGVGNIPSAAALGVPAVNPGPVIISGVGDIPAAGAFGIPEVFLIPKELVLGISICQLAYDTNIRQLSVAPQIRRLQVISDG